MLWAFTNFDQLDKKKWKKFESFLFEMCTLMKRNDLKIIMSRNIGPKTQKIRFRNFHDDESKPMEERFKARLKLAKLPRNSVANRMHNRCQLTGRPHAYYRKLKISRIALRELGSAGQLPGVVKSSW